MEGFTPVTRLEMLLNKIEENTRPGGGGGGDSLYIVTFTWDDNAEKYTCDKTYSDILDHLGRGIVIGFDFTYGFSQQVVQNSETTISFEFLSMMDDTIYHTYLRLADDESVTGVYYGYTLTPDEGGE